MKNISKYLFLFSVFFFGCGQQSDFETASKEPAGGFLKNVEGLDNPKVVFIFPAGAGAMQVSVNILAQLEQDTKVSHIGSLIDLAGGVSSGGLTSAVIAYGKPMYSARQMAPQIAPLVQSVFPAVNRLIGRFKAVFGLNITELNAMVSAFTSSNQAMQFNSTDAIMASLQNSILAAMIKLPSLKDKIQSKAGQNPTLWYAYFKQHLGAEIDALLASVRGAETNPAEVLRTKTYDLLQEEVSTSHPNTRKIITIASYKGQPVVFAPESIGSLFGIPYAKGSNNFITGLVASAAIPGIFTPQVGTFKWPNQNSEKVLSELKDGVAALNGRFDPSEIMYESLRKRYPDENIIFVYIGNGCKVDQNFRHQLRMVEEGVYQETLPNKKTLTYLAIDANIEINGQDAFFMAQFDGSKEMAAVCKQAAHRATQTKPYQWLVKIIKQIK